MKTEPANELYSTTDLGCATAINLYYPLWAIDKSNPQKAVFLFKREEGLDNLIEQFWSNSLEVSALAYFQQLKTLKSRLYENENSRSNSS